ncbi:MAG: rhodanese-like domain-containing protein [Caldilineales bacterium]|nr:rhodanese-like domain-containing protein [Caldilineales bacterium]
METVPAADSPRASAGQPACKFGVVRAARVPPGNKHPQARSLPCSLSLQEPRLAVDLAPIKAPVVLVCRTGRRSRRAAAALQSLGYRNIRILEGGTVAWEAATLLTAIEDFASGGDDVG